MGSGDACPHIDASGYVDMCGTIADGVQLELSHAPVVPNACVQLRARACRIPRRPDREVRRRYIRIRAARLLLAITSLIGT
jgi:hypothetical protein